MFDNKDIFKFINPFSNDIFNNFNSMELQEIIKLLNKYHIELRDNLGINNYITFGLEIETEHTNRTIIELILKKMNLNKNWDMVNDGTLIRGVEINSPILKDNKKTWEDLEKVCCSVNKFAKIDKNSGGHIHVGRQTLDQNKESWLNFIKLWAVYENIIYRFAYGEFLTERPNIMSYAKPAAKFLWEKHEEFIKEDTDLKEIIYSLSFSRNIGVNFNNIKVKGVGFGEKLKTDTFEFRCPNGTLNPIIWQNNVNFFVKLLLYARHNYNDDIVEKRRLEITDKRNIKLYNEIYLEQALELADMLFTNNLDKINYLKQYLKSFKVCDNNIYKKGPKLTKKSRI